MKTEVTKKPEYELAIRQAQAQFELAAKSTGMDWRTEVVFAMQSMANNPFLADTARKNPLSLRLAMVNVAAVGVSLNPAQALAFLIPRDGKVVLDISYRGLLKLATDTGSIVWAKSELVYERDSFVYKGPAEAPEHHSNPFQKDRGEFIGVYCVAKTHGGEFLTEAISAEEIYRIRDMSDLYARKKSGPWVSFFGEQAKKTCLKRAQKTWPKTGPRLAHAIEYLNQEAGEGIDFARTQGNAPEILPSPEMVEEGQRARIANVIGRAVKAKAWLPAEEYFREKYSGQELAYALSELRKAQVETEQEGSESETLSDSE